MKNPIPVVIVQTARQRQNDLKSRVEASGEIIVVREMDNIDAAARAVSTRSARVVLLVADDGPLPGLVTSLMRSVSIPVVVAARSTKGVVAAMAAGAVEGLTVDTPIARLVESLKLMSEVRVVRRITPSARKMPRPAPDIIPPSRAPEGRRLVAIGASTGGPAALAELLKPLPADFPAPIVLAQHMPVDYAGAFARWLTEVTQLQASVAEDGEPARPGHIYIPRGGCDLVLRPGAVMENAQSPGKRAVPSVDRLLESAAALRQFSLFGIVLSGMGHDGMHGLKAMKLAGAATLTQDAESSTVGSMPTSALEHGGASFALAPKLIAQQLLVWASG